MTTDRTTARGLGYLSLGLGLAQLLAPRWFAESIGVEDGRDRRTVVRLIGVRELLAGAGLLMARNPAPWVWLRVGGDLMDLGLLGRAASGRHVEPGRVNTALAGTVAVTALDVASGIAAGNGDGRADGRRDGGTGRMNDMRERFTEAFTGKPVRSAITIGRPVSEVYAYWRRLENLPRFMRHLEEVREIDARRSHWTATAPLGMRVEWDAEITTDVPDTEIGWRSAPDASVRHEGVVRFVTAPGDRGTEIHVELTYVPPAGPLGVAIAKLAGEEPEQTIAEDLRRLKQVMETGAIVRSDATLGERRLRQRPAQPLANPEEAAKPHAILEPVR